MKNTMIIYKTERFTPFIIAIAFLFNSICLLANILFPSVSNFGDVFVLIILLMGILACISSVMRINITLLFINVVIMIAIISSFFFYDSSGIIKTLMINYVAWGIGITIIMMQRIDTHAVLEYAFWIATIIIIFDLLGNVHNNYDAMVWTYAIFPCIAVTIVHYAYCKHKNRILRLTYIPALIMLFKFIMNANRGGLLSLFVLVFFVSIKSGKKTDTQLKSKRMVAIVLSICAVIVAIFFNQIVVFLYNTMASFDYEISALSKMYRLISIDNLSNNRAELYSFAWNGFLESPLLGNGIGGFSVNHGGWVHNLILQLLYEGGILLASLILIPLVKNCVFVLKEKRITAEEYSLFILFFSASIPRLLFSTELWNTQAFWMLFAFCIIISRKYKNKKEDISA